MVVVEKTFVQIKRGEEFRKHEFWIGVCYTSTITSVEHGLQ